MMFHCGISGSNTPYRSFRYGIVALILIAFSVLYADRPHAGDYRRTPDSSIRTDRPAADALLSRAGEAGSHIAKLRLYEEAIRRFHDSADPHVREQVAKAVDEAATLLERNRDHSPKIAEILQLVQNGASADCVPRLLNAQAATASNFKTRYRLYGRVIAEYGDSSDARARSEVLRALYESAGIQGNRKVRLALLDRALAMAGDVEPAAFMRYATGAALARGVLLNDAEERVRGYDIILDLAPRHLESSGGALPYFLHSVLGAKAASLFDPKIATRYYDMIVARDVGPLSTANALRAKARERMPRDERIALFDRIIAEYADSADIRLQRIGASTILDKAWHAADASEQTRLHDLAIEKYQGSPDGGMRAFAAAALFEKARNSTDRAEALVLYGRIMDLGRASAGALQEYSRMAAERTARLTGDASLMQRYYDQRIADSQTDAEAIVHFDDKANSLRRTDEILPVYREIIDRFGDSDDPDIRRRVNDARKRIAEQTEDREEKIRLYDRIIAECDAFDLDEYVLFEAYGKKLALMDTEAEMLGLYDELLARHENDPEIFSPLETMSSPTALDDGSRMAASGYPSIVFVEESLTNSTRRRIVETFLDKAGLVEDVDEKIALYDRIIENYGGAADSLVYRLVRQAAAAKAELLGDASVLEDFIKRRMRMHPGSPETLDVLANRASAIADVSARWAAYDRLVEQYADSDDILVISHVVGILLAKAEATDDADQKRAIYDRVLTIGDIAFLSPFGYGLATALQKRLALAQSPQEKIQVHDIFISRLGRPRMLGPSELAVESLLAKAELVADPEEKVKLCDTLLAIVEMQSESVDLSQFETEAIRIKAGALGDSGFPARYYDRIIDEEARGRIVSRAVAARLALAKTNEEKLRVHDRIPRGQIDFRLLLDKAGLVDDPGEKARLYDQALLLADNDAKELRVLKLKAALAESKTAKIAIYREAFEKFGDRKYSNDSLIPGMEAAFGNVSAIDLAGDWAKLIDDETEKLNLYGMVLEKYKRDFDIVTRRKLGPFLREMLAATGDRKAVLGYYDQRIELAPDDFVRAGEYLEKVSFADSVEARIGILDDMASRFASSADPNMQSYVLNAMKMKAEMTGDLQALATYYGEFARRETAGRRGRLSERAVGALVKQAGVTVDKSAALRLYDEAIAAFRQVDGPFSWGEYTAAMDGKAELTDDPAEKIRCYDELLDELQRELPIARRSHLGPPPRNARRDVPKYLLKKAALLADKAEKVAIYDRIIADFGDANATAAVAAFHAKIDLTADPADKAALCGRLLEFIDVVHEKRLNMNAPSVDVVPNVRALVHRRLDDFRAREYPRALRKLADITGDLSPLCEHYAAAIAEAATEIDRERLDLLKIRDTGGADELTAACDRVIEKYRDYKKRGALALLSLAYTTKAELAAVPEEKIALYDEIIALCAWRSDESVKAIRERAIADKVKALRSQSGVDGFE